jgi:hypothetical protein
MPIAQLRFDSVGTAQVATTSNRTQLMMRGIGTLLSLVLGLATSATAHAQSPCNGMRFDVQTVAADSRPFIRLTLGGKTGPFLLDFGATASTVARSVWNEPGPDIHLSGFNLPSFSAGIFGLRDDTPSLGKSETVHGVIGTDYLSLLTTELHYREAADQHVLISSERCRASLGSLGFKRISTKGYFSSDPNSLRAGVSNVPVIFVNLGGVKAPAQIDTGYDDSVYHHTIELNPAMFDKVNAAVPLVPVGSVSIRTCAGSNRSVPVYVAPHQSLRFEDENGTGLLAFSGFYLLRKEPGACGGIGALEEPAAQIGASFLRTFGTTVFNPKGNEIWIKLAPQ